MKVSRVIFHENCAKKTKPLALCSLVLDDCLMISEVRLFHGEKGYYLVFPSEQDIFRKVREMNRGVDVILPETQYKDEGCTQVKYDEFYHPVDQSFYQSLLSVVVSSYEVYKSTGRTSIRPE